MKVAAIKPLVETYTIEQLQQAEQDIYNETPINIEVEGVDEGEKLTHLLAAIEILLDMKKGVDYKTALRNYSSRVRNSIN